MRKVVIISDTHFFHDAIIKHTRTQYKDIQEMHDDIIKKWNENVGPEDIVIHLGDVAMNALEHKEELKIIFSKLNGIKTLLLGNHDRPIYEKHRHFFNDIGFKCVESARSMTIEVKMYPDEKWEWVVLSHEPLSFQDGWRGEDITNIHGHIHAGPTAMLMLGATRWNACFDVQGFITVYQ